MALFEEIARNGETLGHEDLNCADNSGRVSFKKLFFGKTLTYHLESATRGGKYEKNNKQDLELVSKELNHFGVIACLFRQIGGHSSRFVLFCSF